MMRCDYVCKDFHLMLENFIEKSVVIFLETRYYNYRNKETNNTKMEEIK